MENSDIEYWYMKGIEDFNSFIIDTMEPSQKEATKRMMEAITNQLRRNIRLIKEINEHGNR